MSSYIENISQAATASAAKTATKDAKTDEVLGKEDFLTLLVAQLQNQDPLNPDDPTEFTAQLAQFSSLEQLFNLNEGMDGLVQAYDSADRLSTLGAIGKEVVYSTSSFEFDGEPIVMGYKLDGQASEVTLALRKDGATVAILEGEQLTKGTHYLTWDGTTGGGQPAAPGSYEIILQAKAAEGESVEASPIVRSEVTGVDLDGENGGTLITKIGEVPFNTVLGVYDPASIPKDTQSEDTSEENVNNETAATDTIIDSETDATPEDPSQTG
ncbi:flagellar hook assembly protein FlgD [Desulfosediminicola flagellatus]|uniref:flagellar hook assembly protein FlgD n=1 Tax=Desulfosediminicola flagellatus TaxID=2569541 RepID=UPI0010AC8802|nr:flagellar hook capping FlgD N-terminal domain-containing protein [Desulfosediminicola flagellatus]